MPTIVMLNTVFTGSHGQIMRDLRSEAEAQGFRAVIAYGRGTQETGSDELRFDTKADVLVHGALTRTLDRHARGSLLATRRLVTQLKALRPDMIHLHNAHGFYLHAETLFDYIRAENLPTLWTHHDCWAITGHCSHFVRAGCQRWKTGCHDCPLKRAYPASYMLDASRENWHWKRAAFASVPSLRIVSPSRWLDGVLAESYLHDVPRQVIPNGVDLTRFVPIANINAVRAQYGVKPGQAMLLAVAAPFDERKGYQDALAVAERLGERAKVFLVGLTKKQIAALPPGVVGIRRTDGPGELVSLYGAADCLMNPTYEDTYPTVNMEAMACGTPVASYGVCGATEQMVAPCGVAVPVGDVDALAEAAIWQAQQARALQLQCRAYAEANFDRAKALASYIELYRSMTGE